MNDERQGTTNTTTQQPKDSGDRITNQEETKVDPEQTRAVTPDEKIETV
ncbi:MAG: hypothetical protein HY329_16405 [Chloroflexi bacterium]|nr:hypothetical protein [Chloroflexota bacterium]